MLWGAWRNSRRGSTCSSSYQEIVYGPNGKLALMNGSTLTKAFVAPLPAGAQAVYTSSEVVLLPSRRLAGQFAAGDDPELRTLYYSAAYAPFGEPYAGSGTQGLSFTGQNQDTAASTVRQAEPAVFTTSSIANTHSRCRGAGSRARPGWIKQRPTRPIRKPGTVMRMLQTAR